MSKAPSMPMYWDAYLADTTHLTTEEHGAYMLLMAAMWRRDGSVPDCDADNARILGLTKPKWRKIKARLSQFLIIEGGTISQKKLQETWKKTQEIIQKNKENGAKGGRPISSKSNGLTKPTGSVSVKRNETIPEPEPEPIKRDTKVSQKKPTDPVEEAFVEFWERYPKKVGKPKALSAFKAAAKKHGTDAIMFGLSQHLPALESAETPFRPHPTTWINQERYSDEPEQPSNHGNKHPRGASMPYDADGTTAIALQRVLGQTQGGSDGFS